MTNLPIYIIMGSIRDNETTKGNKMAGFTVKKELRYDHVSHRYLVECRHGKRYAIASSHKKLNRGDTMNCIVTVARSNDRNYLLKKYN